MIFALSGLDPTAEAGDESHLEPIAAQGVGEDHA